MKRFHSELWNTFSRKFYDDAFIAELFIFLRTHSHRQDLILEYGCGEGAVLAGLVKSGFATGIGIDIDPENILTACQQPHPGLMFKTDDWRSYIHNEPADVVLCRGGSLMYGDSWNKLRPTGDQTAQSIRVMYSQVAPEGLLYLDVTPERELAAKPVKHDFVGDHINLQGTVECDFDKKERKLTVEGVFNGKLISYQTTSHLLLKRDLEEIFLEMGVERQNFLFPSFAGEILFEPFCVKKPT